MTRLPLFALILAGISGTALAASPQVGVNAGDVQLALSAGVAAAPCIICGLAEYGDPRDACGPGACPTSSAVPMRCWR